MNARDFCYWLQGWFEINKTIPMREGVPKETLEMIEKHLQYVFTQGDLSKKDTVKPVQDYLEKYQPQTTSPLLPKAPWDGGAIVTC